MLDIPPKLTQVKRSEINDVEQEIIDQFFYLRPVEVGGLLGTSLLPLNKPAIVRQESNVIKETSVPIRIDIKKDGLYDSGTQPIDYNLQRYEQRLLRQKHLPWFNRSNWELRLNSDVTTHLVSKPVDVSLESNNNAIATKMLSAVLSHRNNANKSKFYRLDLTIGTIAFHDHPLFCKEDYYAHQLMKQFRQYEERVDLNQVDHLNERLNFLQGELDVAHQEYETLSQYPSTTQQEKNKIIYERIKLLEHHISLTERLLNEERAAIDTMARNLYVLWGNIKNERVNNRFNSTSVKLQVREYMSDVMEYDFYLMQTEPSLQTHQGTPLPSAENRRRQNIAQTRIFVRILINDIYVARTRKVFLQWPKFEALFNQRFQLHVFTRPVKIRLEVCSGYRVATKLAVIEIEPPGLNVRALTSSAQIIRHQNFEAGPIQSFVPEQPRNLCGDVTFKAEWATRSYRVPPIRFEDIALLRNLSHLASIKATDFNIDRNDPRNKELIEQLRKQRSKALEDLLARDSMFPHHKFSSLRELLMKFRFRNTELVNLPIPLLERDIINSSIFMDFIRSLQYITEDNSNRITLFYIQRYRRQYSPYSNCTIMMLELMNQVIERQNQIKLGVQTTLHSAKNIVSEVQLPDTSAFAQCMKLLFSPRRKLKPAKGQLEAVSAVNINKSRIHIIVYKGQNVPVRDEAFTIRYPQAERFYQAIPPAAPRQQPGMPMDPPFYGYQMSPRGTGGEFRPPSPGRGYPPDYYQRAQQPGELPPPPPVHGQGFEQKERVQSFIEVNLIHNGKSRTVRTAPFEGQSPE